MGNICTCKVTLWRVRVTTVVKETQQWVPFVLLSGYKIFRTAINNINVFRSSHKLGDTVARFYSNLEFLDTFSYKSSKPKFKKIRPMEAALLHADRRTDRHKEDARGFSRLCESY